MALRVLGIDPGSRATGWALVIAEGNRYQFERAGVIRPRGNERHRRLSNLREVLARVVEELAPDSEVVIMSAAVADFRPVTTRSSKIKKGAGGPDLKLEGTEDILARLQTIAPNALRIGFAAETGELEEEARRKMKEKGAHWIVANDVSRSDIGFGSEHNEVTVFRRNKPAVTLGRQAKRRIAGRLLDLVKQELDGVEAEVAVTSG